MATRIAGIMVLAIIAVICIATPSHTGGAPVGYVHQYGIMPHVFTNGSPGGGGEDGHERMTAILDEISLENAATGPSADTSDLPMANTYFLIRTGPIRIDTSGGGPLPPPMCPPACPKHRLIVDEAYALRLKAELAKLEHIIDSLIDSKPGMKN